MFGRHFRHELSAFAHGELTPVEADRVARHIDACNACRREYEQVCFGIRLAEHLPVVSAPDSVWDAIESSLVKQKWTTNKAHASRGGILQTLRLLTSKHKLAVASLALLLFFGAGAFLIYRRATLNAWEVTSLQGAPFINAKRINKESLLAVGSLLETDEGSRAQIKVADIGQVEVEPSTRVRLVETRLTEHRLELERGRISARIWAPPRLFFVNTPTAVAEDLGCAYTLEVDEAGRSLLRVSHGWVAMVREGRESMVPAGAACVTQAPTGPGTPFFEDASERFVEALSRFDFEGGGTEALDIVLSEARRRDTLSLWHLLPRVEGKDRERVFERLINLSPPPAGVTREGIMHLDPQMLEDWKENMEPVWVQEDFPAVRRAWRKMWDFRK